MNDMPSFSSEAYNPDRLIAGDFPILTADVTLLDGEDLARGSVLGKVTIGTLTPAVATGDFDGALGAWTAGPLTQVGVYRLVCIAESADAGTFAVYAPDGSRLADLTVAVAYAGGHINGTIADGAEDADVGDVVTITVAAGSGKHLLSLSAAVDGSQHPVAILARDTDASAADVDNVPVYISGEFNEERLVFGAGHTAATVRDALRDLNIHLKSPHAATDAS